MVLVVKELGRQSLGYWGRHNRTLSGALARSLCSDAVCGEERVEWYSPGACGGQMENNGCLA